MSALKTRLPYGSSLTACVHRLARLQTMREMQPRPENVDRREPALDRLIVAARQVVRLSGVVLVVLGIGR